MAVAGAGAGGCCLSFCFTVFVSLWFADHAAVVAVVAVGVVVAGIVAVAVATAVDVAGGCCSCDLGECS